MTNDLEARVVSVLHRRADDEVDADRLLSASLIRGLARQRRRRVTMAFGLAGVAGLTAAALAAVPLVLAPGGGSETGSSDGADDASQGLKDVVPTDGPIQGVPYPLPASGAHHVPQLAGTGPGAADRPDLVGTNPLAIHFGIADVPLPVQGVSWSSGTDGVERAAVGFKRSRRGLPLNFRVDVARGTVPRPQRSGPGDGPSVSATKQGTIGGRPVTREKLTEGESVWYAIRWYPVDGVEVRVESEFLSYEDLVRIGLLVKLDRSVRCTAPLQVTDLPAEAAVTGCRMDLESNSPPGSGAELTLGRGDSSMRVIVSSQVFPAASSNVKPSITLPGGVLAGEIPAVDGIQGPGVVIYDLDRRHVNVITEAGYGAEDALLVAKGLRPAGKPAQPGTWPERPVS